MARAKAPARPQVVEQSTIDPMDLPPRHYADHEAREGHFASVVEGPHSGCYGYVASIGDVEENGRPRTAVLKTRDDLDESLLVQYDHLRPDVAGRR